jgi:hypothetical protein
MGQTAAVDEIHCYCHQHIPGGHQRAKPRLILPLHHPEKELATGRIERGVPNCGQEPHPGALEEPQQEELESDVPADTSTHDSSPLNMM